MGGMEEKDYTEWITSEPIGIRSILFQSFIRVPDPHHPENSHSVSTQSYWDDWEKIFVLPMDGEEGVFRLKSRPWNTFLQASPGVGMFVEQTQDGTASGTKWKITKLTSVASRSFGTVSGIKTIHGTLWAEGRTRSGKSVLTTAKRVSDLTQFTISRINGTDTANIVSPSGKFLTQTFGTSTLKLEELPSEDAVFALEQLDDQFFSIRSMGGKYARTGPGALGRVDANADKPEEWTKLARVDPPGTVFHIQSEFGTFLQVTGPPEEPLITAEENSQAKWEIDAPWADLPDLFPTE